MTLRFKPALIGVAILLLASACSTTTTVAADPGFVAATDAVDTETPSAVASVAFNENEYCEALATLLVAEPPDTLEPEALDEFAVLIDEVVPIALPEHQETLRLAAESNRDPSVLFEEGALEEFTIGMDNVVAYATTVCGHDLDEAGSESGSASTEVEVSTSASSNGSAMFIPEGPGTEAPRPLLTGSEADKAAAINNTLGTESGLSFEWATVHEEDDEDRPARVLLPSGWPIDVGSFGVEVGSGFGNSMEFSANCQGICAPQRWVEVMDDPELSPFALFESSDASVILRQELSDPAGRLLVSATTGSFAETTVTLTRWSDEANAFFECEATLEEDLAPLWPAFADACIAADPEWF